ncbi:MAG: hypothetical protein IJ223_01555 [Clostridia bacterium]|nr:hypothetical protein [Clostridia bacterium]
MCWWGDQSRECPHCLYFSKKCEFRKLAKIDNGNVKFFSECPICRELEEIHPDSLDKGEKESLIWHAKNDKYVNLFIILFVLCFFIIIYLIWSYSPQLLITLAIIIFVLFTFLDPL